MLLSNKLLKKMRKKNFSYKLILKRPMVLAAAVLAAGIITGQYIGINGCIALIVLSIIISIVTGILTRARFVYMVPILLTVIGIIICRIRTLILPRIGKMLFIRNRLPGIGMSLL